LTLEKVGATSRRLPRSAGSLTEADFDTVSKSVEKLPADFEAIVYWLRPPFQASKIQLPTHVALDLEQECPGLLEYVNTHISAAYAERSRSWQRLFNWGRITFYRTRKRKAGLTSFYIMHAFTPAIYA